LITKGQEEEEEEEEERALTLAGGIDLQIATL